MDYLDKCRLCLEEFKKHQRTEINEAVRKEFFDLTNSKLQDCSDYSKNVCKKCLKDLLKSSKIKKKFLENQLKLQNLIEKEVKQEIKIEKEVDVEIKEESVVDVDPIALELKSTLEDEKSESSKLNVGTPEETSLEKKPIKTRTSKRKTKTSSKRSKSLANNPQMLNNT